MTENCACIPDRNPHHAVVNRPARLGPPRVFASSVPGIPGIVAPLPRPKSAKALGLSFRRAFLVGALLLTGSGVFSSEAQVSGGSTVLANISTRLVGGTGDEVGIGGFIVTGTQPKKVIVRAIGPSLMFPRKLANPTLGLYARDGGLIASNDDWRSTQEAQIIATGLQPTEDLESAIIATLPASPAGIGYTAIMSGVNDTTGLGLVEVYDLDSAADSKLANISTRGPVLKGIGVMIGGVIVVGPDPQKVIVRALGPSLGSAGVMGALRDPTLELHDSEGNLIASNDNWRDTQEAEILATGLQPTNDMESAIVATLPSSPSGILYTAVVQGMNGMSGIALVEFYALAP
jgi:hypothetical protein